MPRRYTEEELEEIRYEKWLMSGGPDKARAEHQAAARASLAGEISEAGWSVLHSQAERWELSDYDVLEAVVRREMEVRIIRWKPFNRGWMTPSPSGGWLIWRPEEVDAN